MGKHQRFSENSVENDPVERLLATYTSPIARLSLLRNPEHYIRARLERDVTQLLRSRDKEEATAAFRIAWEKAAALSLPKEVVRHEVTKAQLGQHLDTMAARKIASSYT